MKDRLTKRTDEELEELEGRLASSLTFNELLALAGQRLDVRAGQVRHTMGNSDEQATIDAGRDCSVAHTALEDALMRYNSATYRLKGTWKRVDPDRHTHTVS